MKILKWLLFFVILCSVVILITLQTLPSSIVVSSRKDVPVMPYQAFHNIATFTDRNLWDPPLKEDPSVEYSRVVQPDYAGSAYSWQGAKGKSCKIQVDSVILWQFISSSVRVGEDQETFRNEWYFEPVEFGTIITWESFTEGKDPVKKIKLNLKKRSMARDLENGLENLSDYLEENPPQLSSLGPIEETTLPRMFSLVIPDSGNIEEIGTRVWEYFDRIGDETARQGIEITGAPFCNIVSFNEETGISGFLAGIPVSSRGKDADGIKAMEYQEKNVVQATHWGPYEEFRYSYGEIIDYIQSNQMDAVYESIEFYYTDPAEEPDVRKWKTLIVFPTK